jgi:tetratricopeptide (TPR) repeat protein
MDPKAMDDKLYYVESPDGRVLGPMNMIQILEGIAAGAILDDARICEVGGQDWVELSDVAYTRDESTSLATAFPMEHVPAEGGPETSSFVPATEGPADVPAEGIAEPPATEEFPAGEFWSAADSADAATPDEAPVPGAPEAPKTFPGTEAGWPAPDAAEQETAQLLTPPEEAGVSSAEDVLVSAHSGEEGAGDFALDIDQVEEEGVEEEALAATGASGGSKRWTVPVAGAVAVPVIIGIYLMAGGRIPFFSGDRDSYIPTTEIAAPRSPAAGGAETPGPAGANLIEAGWAALRDGKPRKAIRDFDQALASDPDNTTALHGRGAASLKLGDGEDAVVHLKRAVELDPKSVPYVLDLGRALLAADRPREAGEAAEKVLEISPDEWPARLVRGRARLAIGNVEGALEDLAAFVEERPAARSARLDLARALAAAGRTEPAIDEVNIYLETFPDDQNAQRERLDWMLAVGRQAEAVALYGHLAREHPADANIQYLAGLACAETEDKMVYLKRTIQIQPDHADAFSAMARTLASAGRTDEAKRALQQARSIRPATPEETTLLARLEKSATATAKPETKRAPAPKPEAPAAKSTSPRLASRIEAVRDALDREDYAGARHVLEKATMELSRDAEAKRNLGLWVGIVAFEEGQFDDAVAAFGKLDSNASYEASGMGAGTVGNWLARSHFARGDVRAAVAVLDQVGSKDKDEYAIARLWEGVALSSLGMEDLANRTWTRIPQDVGSRVGPQGKAALRSAEFLAGQISEKEYRGAVSSILDFENDMHYFLGYAARRSEDSDTALVHFREAVRSSKGHDFPYHLAESEIVGEGIGVR